MSCFISFFTDSPEKLPRDTPPRHSPEKLPREIPPRHSPETLLNMAFPWEESLPMLLLIFKATRSHKSFHNDFCLTL